MTPETFALVVGPFGATALLLYIAKLLWDAHAREDVARDARIAALDASVDKLADAVRDSTAILIEIRDQRVREVRARVRAAK